MNCENCNKQTKNPKFCSRSCSATYTNTHYVKKKRTKICKDCDKLILSNYTRCTKCYELTKVINSNKTIKDLHATRRYQRSSRIRDIARREYKKSNKSKQCKICGYNKHYHVCHIKAIKSFHEDTLISEINNINNLVALCPNHHWELDNKQLNLVVPGGFEPPQNG